MRTGLLAMLLLMLPANAIFAEEVDAVRLAGDLIVAENARLKNEAQGLKGVLKTARLTSLTELNQYKHRIAKMESSVAMNERLIRQNDPELLVLTARAIAEGNLERNYAEQADFKPKPEANPEYLQRRSAALREYEQKALGELKILKDWLKKREADDGDKGLMRAADGKLSLTERWQALFGLDGKLKVSQAQRDARAAPADGDIRLSFEAEPALSGWYAFTFIWVDETGRTCQVRTAQLHVYEAAKNSKPPVVSPERETGSLRAVAAPGSKVHVEWSYYPGGEGDEGGWKLASTSFSAKSPTGVPGYEKATGE